MSEQVVFIGVTYASDDTAVEFARQLAPLCSECDVAAILVDNGPRLLQAEFEAQVNAVNPHMRYLNFGRNLGYFGGAERAYELIASEGAAPKWVVVSNVDVDFRGSDFLDRLQAERIPEDVGVLAPAIISRRTGLDQNPHFLERPSAARMRFYRFVFTRFWLRTAYEAISALAAPVRSAVAAANRLMGGRRRVATDRTGTGRVVYAPHGACIVFRDAYFRAGGSLCYPGFLFGEEIFVAETCRQRGLKVLYVPALKVAHREHTSTRAVPSRRIASHAATSSTYLASEFFGARAAPRPKHRSDAGL